MIEDIKFNITIFTISIIEFFKEYWVPVLKQFNPRSLYYMARYGKWEHGYDHWENKPRFGLYHVYYDGNHLVLHIGNHYISVYY